MNYFKNTNTLEELKAQYKTLVKKHHPDICKDDGHAMKMINAEYDRILSSGIKNHKNEEMSQDEINLSKEYREVIERVAVLQGIIIELCGSWIWLTGNTKEHKEILKSIKCRFSKKKTAWYWRPNDEKKRFSKYRLSLEEIRRLHGSKVIAGSRQRLLFS